MRQKIITSMLHVVSNPHSDLCDCLATKLFDVTISDLSNNKSYPTFFCEYHSHVQHYLSTFRTLNSLMFVAYKKFFLCCNKHVAQFFMLTKNFCWHIFFQKIFSFIYYSSGTKYPLFSLQEGNKREFFPYRYNIWYFKIFWNKLYPAKMFCITFHYRVCFGDISKRNLPGYTVALLDVR